MHINYYLDKVFIIIIIIIWLAGSSEAGQFYWES